MEQKSILVDSDKGMAVAMAKILEDGADRTFEKMDIIEFVEKITGLELCDFQKELLKKSASVGECHIVYGRYGRVYVVPKKVKEG